MIVDAITGKRIATPVLDIAYREHGPADGLPVVLLHGFPYDAYGYDEAATMLGTAGLRIIAPDLRGYGGTRFLSSETLRSGEQAALGKDLLDLLDVLNIERAVLGGYDWGGRAACVVSALWPERVCGLLTCNGYNIQNIAASAAPADPAQEMRFWYQYFFSLSAVATGSRNTAMSFASCYGGTGRRHGRLTSKPMRARRRHSRTRISSTS